MKHYHVKDFEEFHAILAREAAAMKYNAFSTMPGAAPEHLFIKGHGEDGKIYDGVGGREVCSIEFYLNSTDDRRDYGRVALRSLLGI